MFIITLLTDFGTADTYVGQMKGVIAGIAPRATVIDLTHAIGPQNVLHGAIALDDAIDAFPTGTIHVAVVDPGVGGDRRAIAVQTERYTFVGPDNGIFTAALARHHMKQAVHLPAEVGSPAVTTVSATFHGRDIFAPAAARLATGTEITDLGEPVTDIVQLDIPQPEIAADAIIGRVLLTDRFGNLITNIKREHVPAAAAVTIADTAVPLRRTFADVDPGEPVAYIGSSGRLEIAIRDGSAVDRFGVDGRVTVRRR